MRSQDFTLGGGTEARCTFLSLSKVRAPPAAARSIFLPTSQQSQFFLHKKIHGDWRGLCPPLATPRGGPVMQMTSMNRLPVSASDRAHTYTYTVSHRHRINTLFHRKSPHFNHIEIFQKVHQTVLFYPGYIIPPILAFLFVFNVKEAQSLIHRRSQGCMCNPQGEN